MFHLRSSFVASSHPCMGEVVMVGTGCGDREMRTKSLDVISREDLPSNDATTSLGFLAPCDSASSMVTFFGSTTGRNERDRGQMGVIKRQSSLG